MGVFRRERPDRTILDLRMPDVSCLDVSKEIHAMAPSATVIVYSRMAGGTVEQQVHALGASEVVDKGDSLRPLGQVLNQVG